MASYWKSVKYLHLLPREMKTEGGRQCHTAAGVCLKDIVGLEGVELGANGKVRLLLSTT